MYERKITRLYINRNDNTHMANFLSPGIGAGPKHKITRTQMPLIVDCLTHAELLDRRAAQLDAMLLEDVTRET